MAELISAKDYLNQPQVQKSFFKEYLTGNTLSPFMGTGNNSVIKVDYDKERGQGDTFIVSLKEHFKNDYSFGNETLEGTGEDMKVFTDKITVNLVRNAGKFENRRMQKVRSVEDYESYVKPDLVDLTQEQLRDNLIDAMTDVTRGRQQSRYMYGTDEANYDATHLTACGNVTQADQMSVDFIRKARKKAGIPFNGAGNEKSRKLKPIKVANDNGTNSRYFVAFLNPCAAEQLRNDPMYINQDLYNRGRDGGPKITNTHLYMGMVDTTMVYVIEELDRASEGTKVMKMFRPEQEDAAENMTYVREDLRTAGANAKPVVHSLFCGANAACLAYAGKPVFTQKEMDHDKDIEIGVTQVYACKKLLFRERNEVNGQVAETDHGIIHMFSAGEEM